MNTEQTKLIEENHNLIYSFLRRYKLPEDEYYDLAAIGLCRAATSFNQEKGAFSTYCYRCMYNEIMNEIRTSNTQKRTPESLLRLHQIVATDSRGNKVLLQDTISAKDNTERSAINKVMFEGCLSRLNNDKRKVAKMLMDGFTKKQIAVDMGVSRQWVSALYAGIKKEFIKSYGKQRGYLDE